MCGVLLCARCATRPGPLGLEPEHFLGDDVALDLVRAAVNRGLAVIEIGTRCRDGRARAHRAAVKALLELRRHEGQGVVSRQLDEEFVDALRYFGALYLQDR